MKLGKLKMPKREEINVDELDLGPESAEEEMEVGEEEEEAEEEESALAQVSDEELLAEVKKRGLMSQLEGETGEEPAEEQYV